MKRFCFLLALTLALFPMLSAGSRAATPLQLEECTAFPSRYPNPPSQSGEVYCSAKNIPSVWPEGDGGCFLGDIIGDRLRYWLDESKSIWYVVTVCPRPKYQEMISQLSASPQFHPAEKVTLKNMRGYPVAQAGIAGKAAASSSAPGGSMAGMADTREIAKAKSDKPKSVKPVNDCYDRATTNNSTYPHQHVNKCSFPITVTYCVVNGKQMCDCKNPAKPSGECSVDLKVGQRETAVTGFGEIKFTACRSDVKEGWVSAKMENGKSRCDLH